MHGTARHCVWGSVSCSRCKVHEVNKPDLIDPWSHFSKGVIVGTTMAHWWQLLLWNSAWGSMSAKEECISYLVSQMLLNLPHGPVKQPHLNWQEVSELSGWCTDRTGLKWHWMNDRARCRADSHEPSCIPYRKVLMIQVGKRINPRPWSSEWLQIPNVRHGRPTGPSVASVKQRRANA